MRGVDNQSWCRTFLVITVVPNGIKQNARTRSCYSTDIKTSTVRTMAFNNPPVHPHINHRPIDAWSCLVRKELRGRTVLMGTYQMKFDQSQRKPHIMLEGQCCRIMYSPLGPLLSELLQPCSHSRGHTHIDSPIYQKLITAYNSIVR